MLFIAYPLLKHLIIGPRIYSDVIVLVSVIYVACRGELVQSAVTAFPLTKTCE
jgi:hypothetical protein